MVTPAIFIALIGTLQVKAAISAAISYEPIQITVNENFNAETSQVPSEFKSNLEPGVVHQGANFYFKPKFNLPSTSIPHHIEALMSLIQQHHSCAKDATKVVFEKEKLMDILMPFLNPKEALSNSLMEEENNSEIVKTVPILITEEPAVSELEVIPEAPVLPPLSFNGIPSIVEEEVKKEESVILEESTGLFSGVEPKPATLELVIIPEAPVLPPLSANDIDNVEKVTVEEPITLTIPEPIVVDVETKPVTPNLLVIPEAPVLPPLSFNGIPSTVEEEVKKEESVISKPTITVGPITEPIITYEDPKPTTSGLLIIPEAPVLPSLSFNGMNSFVEKKVKKEESIILDESTSVSQEPTIIENEPKPATTELVIVPEAPILPPISGNDIRIVNEVKIEEPISLPIPEPILVDFEPKPKTTTSKLVVIPEAPAVPPLSFNDIRTFVEEELEKKESVILQDSKGVSQEPTIIEIEPEPVTPEHEFIPEAPVLPPLLFSGIPASVEEEVKTEESVLLEELTGVSQAPILIEIEPKPTTPEPQVIPEAPMLPPLSFNRIPAFVEKEVKKEESVILEESTGVLQEPNIIEVEPKPTTPEFSIIPEAPVLPPLYFRDIHTFVKEEMKNKESILEGSKGEPLEPTIIEIETKPATLKLEVMPEAPVLPPLSFNGFPDIIKEEVKKEESVLLQESTGLFPESTITEVEPKNAIPQLLVIPEAPVLPPLSLNDMSQVVEKELKKEESIRLEEPQEPTIIAKPATTEFKIMPEAPVLPPLSANDIRIVEEVNIEEPIILPIPESINLDIEPKPATPEFLIVPEAPMLPPLSFNGFPSVVEEEVKKEESVMLKESTGVLQEPTLIEVEPKPATPELIVIPEAPLLPPRAQIPVIEEINSVEPVSVEESAGSIAEISAPTLESFVETETAESFALENNIFPVATEEIKIEIPILLEESIEMFPPIEEISSGPTLQEPEITNPMTNSYVFEEVSQRNPEPVVGVKKTLPPTIIRKPSNNLGVISYAPFLSHLSNHGPKTKQVMFPKPASLERFLLKKHPFMLPVTPFPKLSLNAMKSPISENKNHFLFPTAYAHDVVEKRIAPNMAFKKNAPPKRVKIYVRSNVPKGPSYL